MKIFRVHSKFLDIDEYFLHEERAKTFRKEENKKYRIWLKESDPSSDWEGYDIPYIEEIAVDTTTEPLG